MKNIEKFYKGSNDFVNAYEKKEYPEYKKIFLTKKRINIEFF